MKYVLLIALVAIFGGVSADLRQDLLQHADILIRHADEALKFLESHNRQGEGDTIRKDEALLKQMVQELNSSHSNVSELEHKMATIEGRLFEEIRRIHQHGLLKKRDLRDALLVRAEFVLKNAEKAIHTLKTEHKTKQAAAVEKDVSHLKKLVAELKAITDKTADITHYDVQISIVEVKILDEIKNVKAANVTIEEIGNGTRRIRRDVQKDLLETSAKLLSKVRLGVEDLKSKGRDELAANLDKIEKMLEKLDTRIRNIDPHSILGRQALRMLEILIENSEKVVKSALKSLH